MTGAPVLDALREAVLDEDAVEVARLLRAGADPNVAGADDGATPLLFAIEHNAAEITRLLLEHGADVNVAGDVSDVFGPQSPLMLAAQQNGVALGRRLLELGADPDRFADNDGENALHYAASRGHTEFVSLLLEHGANPFARSAPYDEKTALEFAIRGKHWGTAELLYRHWNQSNPNALGSPVHALAGLGDMRRLEALLDSGASVELRDGAGRTALHWAAGEPRVALARLILGKSDDASVVPRAARSHTGVVDLLLRRGADIDAVDAFGDTALHDALAWGGKMQLSLAEQLARAGADVRRKDQTGWTPLLLAARARASPALIGALFERGADPSDQQGTWNALTYAAHGGTVATVEALIAHGVALQFVGRPALHAAASMGHAEVVDVLLRAGADPSARDTEGKTPADVAGKHVKIVAQLRAATRRGGKS